MEGILADGPSFCTYGVNTETIHSHRSTIDIVSIEHFAHRIVRALVSGNHCVQAIFHFVELAQGVHWNDVVERSL